MIGAPSIATAETDLEKNLRLLASIAWKDGPCTAQLGQVAEIDVPAGFRFTDAAGARTWAEVTGNPPSADCLGVLIPTSLDWHITFDFGAVGYVKDDEQDSLDAAALLAGIRANTARANAYRRQQGWSEVRVVRWEQPPAYSRDSHQLYWAILGDVDDGPVVNYNTRILGRGGVMSVNLVDAPKTFASVVPLVKGILTGFRFREGQRYAEWRSGDKVAQYGLGALVVGGGTAVAAKTGLLAKLWKPILAVIVAIIAWLKRGRLQGALRKRS